MKSIYTLLFTLCYLAFSAQHILSQKAINYEQVLLERSEAGFEAAYLVRLDGVMLKSNEMLLVLPRLEALNGDRQYHFSPLIISGSKKAKILDRSQTLSGKDVDIPVYVRKNKSDQAVIAKLSAPFESWMNEARLVFEEELSGCAACVLEKRSFVVNLSEVAPYVPDYLLTYLTPKAEAVKERSKGYAAKFSYKVGKYDILPDFAGNAQVISEITNLIDEVKADKNLTVTGITITGYASPEGSSTANFRLSENRAKAFAHWFTTRYAIAAEQVTVDWKGEDWEGFRQMIESSHFTEKEAVLAIITNGQSDDEREKVLRQLDQGAVFRTMLTDYFPALRRNELQVNFVVKAFDIEEARTIIRTTPHYLSLNEMYLVASSYPKASVEFKEVFDIASRLYPQDPVAQLNAATAEIEAGSLERAILILKKNDTPEAWNNLGVAYAKKGDRTQAIHWLTKAANAGQNNAKHNLIELEKMKR